MEAAVARYGRGNFRWVTMAGDISSISMCDEINPALACEMAIESIGNPPKWTGGRRRDFVNMPYAGGQVQWGKANRDSRLTVDLEQLMQMAIFDCAVDTGAEAGGGSEWLVDYRRLQTSIARVVQSLEMKGEELQQRARLLHQLWVALKL